MNVCYRNSRFEQFMNQKFKILVVDDSVEWLKSHIELIYQFFGEDLFEVNTAISAHKAFNRIFEKPDYKYDLIITDLEMEKIFGEEYAGNWLINNLINREECKDTRFLIISGSYNIRDIAEKFKVSHIPKSFLIDNPLLLKYKICELLNMTDT